MKNLLFYMYTSLFYFSNLFSLYSIWSKIYRSIYQSMFKSIPLDVNLSPESAWLRMKDLTWTKDGYKEFFDAIGSPHWVQHCINQVRRGHEQPHGALDCDEYSAWAVETLHRRYCPLLLSVAYMKKDGYAPVGHNVCVFIDRDSKIYHLSNWGISGPFNNLRELIENICHAADAKKIGWAIHNRSLKHLRFGVRYPKDMDFEALKSIYYLTY